MKRRKVMALIAGSAAACLARTWPLSAQPAGNVLKLGALIYGRPGVDRQIETVVRTLRDLGYVEGQTLRVETRYAEANPERLPKLAEELVALNPDMVIAFGGDVAPFVRNVTRTIPIVFAVSADPKRLGLVESLARPGGNATGVTYLQDELASKRVQIFKELAPRMSRMAVVWNPDHPDNELRQAEQAAHSLGIEIQSMAVRNTRALAEACRAAVDADALYVVSSRLTAANIATLVEFSHQNRLPLAGGWGAWASAGALMSYGPNITEMVALAATYVSKIHKGAKPAALPVAQPTRFELVVNLRAAKMLGLAVPESFIAQADEVIE
jgi:putative ABC transport system substrate-binding protein